ncbi:hypothetical protein NW762_007838 [Fusarium torreyae]|uniref:HNH nuclease domain-containing protein n=1 Tax=Fusarium torreyae TaxID=1237075 RepID=A0A9W8RXZ5_9HYPO|nr:hypothetical protein NW762_007838 [Fusarium torreyae]
MFQDLGSMLQDVEIEKRRGYAYNVETILRGCHDPHFRLNHKHLATFLTVPKVTLKRGGKLSCSQPRDIQKLQDTQNDASPFTELYDRLENVWRFARYYMQRLIRIKVEDDVTSNKAKEKKDYSHPEEIKCLERDGNACAITRLPNPEVCHIYPFAFNNRENTVDLFKATKTLLGEKFYNHYRQYFADPSQPTATNRIWNMICLNPQLHSWWCKGYFAFKCMGIQPMPGSLNDEVTVIVQFRWMPGISRKLDDPIRLYGAPNDFDTLIKEVNEFHDLIDSKSEHLEDLRATGMQLPTSGYYLFFIMNMDDSLKFKDMIDLQWACIKLIALSGGLDSPALYLDDEQDEYLTDQLPILPVEEVESIQAQQ